MSVSLSDISLGLSIYVSPSILVDQIYCACSFCSSLIIKIFSLSGYRGMDFFDQKIFGNHAVLQFSNSIRYINNSERWVSIEPVSQRAGVSRKGGAPLAQNCLREGRPMPMMRFYLLIVHDTFLALGVFFQTALAPLPYFLSSLSSTSALSTK